MPTLSKLPNVFISTLSQTLTQGGSETVFHLSSIMTYDGQLISTADFALFGRGLITIAPTNLQSVEVCSFTAVDNSTPSDPQLTGCIRGLSSKDSTVITANKKYHSVSTPVIIAFGTQNLEDLENLILVARIQSVVSAATVTPNVDFNDCIDITAQAVALSFVNPLGTPTNFQSIIIRLKDNGSPQTIAWDTEYQGTFNLLPIVTIANKEMILGFVWNPTTSKWELWSLGNAL